MTSSSTITSLGVGSNLDLSSLLDNLKSAEQQRLTPLQTRETSYKSQLSAYGQLQSALTGLQTATRAVAAPALFDSVKLSSTSASVAASGSSDAVVGSYSVQVDQLAQAQSLVAGGVASRTDAIGQGGTLSLSVGDASGNVSKQVTINLAAGDSSLEGIRDAINASGAGVSASIVSDGSDRPYRLVLSANATGSNAQISVSATDNDPGGSGATPLADLLDYDSQTGQGQLQQTVAAQNARLQVNGIAVVSQSNKVSDAIQGVSLSLTATTTSPVTVAATRDNDGITKTITSFVNAFNAYKKVSGQLTAFNGVGQANGVLMGDATTRSVQSQLLGVLGTPVSGGAFSGLSQIGISLQTDGTMAIDDDALSAALDKNPADVAALIAGDATHPGVASNLSKTLDRLTASDGIVQAATDGTQKSINDVEASKTSMQTSIDATVERYRQQFVKLDTLLSSLDATKSYLTTQLSQLNDSDN